MNRRLRIAYAAMIALTLIVLGFATWVPWHSVLSVDNRTYAEMIRGVAETGLPCLQNGPAAEFPELRARFNQVYQGRLCGSYPPLFVYAAQPAFRAGGLRGVIRFNVALLAAVAWIAFWIGRRVLRDPIAAAVAGWLSILSSPSLMMASDASSYTLGIVFTLGSIALAVESVERGARRQIWLACAAGLSGGLAAGTQLLVAPMALAIVALLFVLHREEEAAHPYRSTQWERWIPCRASIARGLAAAGGLLVPLMLVAAVNHARFGVLSPLGTGPCVWGICHTSGITNQAPSVMLRYAAPTFAWMVAFAVSWRFVGDWQRGRMVVAVAFLAMLGPDGTLHDHTLRLFRLAWGFFVDASNLDIGDFWRPPDRLGVFLGPFAVRSSMQGAPAIALAFAARSSNERQRTGMTVVGGAAAALYLSLSLRAPVPTIHALGFPFVSLRYVSPGVPLLLVLAVAAVQDLPWRKAHVAIGCVIAFVATVTLWKTLGDGEWSRRVVLLILLPAGGFLALLIALRHSVKPSARTGAALAALATVVFGLGVGATLGVDGRAVYDVRGANDARVDALSRVAPQRFAVVGWAPQIDTALALRTSRDVQYADLYESANWANFRILIDRWSADGRPIFALWPSDTIASPWREVTFVPVNRAEHIYRVVRAP